MNIAGFYTETTRPAANATLFYWRCTTGKDTIYLVDLLFKYFNL